MTHPQIALIVSGFPRRSETFALNELHALAARGLLAGIFATKPGDGLLPQPGGESLLDYVRMVPPGDAPTQAAWITARLAGHAVQGVHGYFAHTPTEVAIQVAQRLGVPFGFSVHAKDARKVAPAELTARARAAACVIACNIDTVDYLRCNKAPVCLVPHGVDVRRFTPRPFPLDCPLRLLAVGRLVEKKGFNVLLEAVERLSLPFHLRIIGDGPEYSRLTENVRTLGLAERVTLCSGRTHEELPAEYANAHLVVVPSVCDQTGDRDGLPNVVLEALASGRPVVASTVGAITSVVINRENGLLFRPGDSSALATALTSLADQPTLRERYGQKGRTRVERDYALGSCTDRFCSVLEAVYA